MLGTSQIGQHIGSVLYKMIREWSVCLWEECVYVKKTHIGSYWTYLQASKGYILVLHLGLEHTEHWETHAG